MRRFNFADGEIPGGRATILVAGVLAAALLFGLLNLLTGARPHTKAVVAPTSSTTADSTATTPNPAVTTPGAQTPASPGIPKVDLSTPTTMSEQQIEHPESAILNATQLAYDYSQPSSGLDPVLYRTSVEVAQRFSLASATGDGAADFNDYFTQSRVPQHTWLTNYKLIYATAMATGDPNYIKAMVWFSGTQIQYNQPLQQVRFGFYLQRQVDGSIIPWAAQAANGSNDPDIGLSITQ